MSLCVPSRLTNKIAASYSAAILRGKSRINEKSPFSGLFSFISHSAPHSPAILRRQDSVHRKAESRRQPVHCRNSEATGLHYGQVLRVKLFYKSAETRKNLKSNPLQTKKTPRLTLGVRKLGLEPWFTQSGTDGAKLQHIYCVHMKNSSTFARLRSTCC